MSTITEPRPVDAADQAPTPRSRRRRIPVRFIVFGVLAIGVAVAFAWLLSWYSPIPVRDVMVTGAEPEKESEVVAAAGIAPGTSIRDIDVAGVTERVTAIAGIESVDIVLDRPFTIDLRVVERVPFAVGETAAGWVVLDQSGAVITDVADRPEKLPQVTAPDGNVRPATVALAALPEDVRSRAKSAVVAADGVVTITIGPGVTVNWGTSGQDELKGQTVAQLLVFKPEGINVSVPQRPALTGDLDLPKENRLPEESLTTP